MSTRDEAVNDIINIYVCLFNIIKYQCNNDVLVDMLYCGFTCVSV